MTTEAQPEIYLRDVSSIESVQLYFQHNIYKCQSKYYESARRNLYFAPYFTRQMAAKISEVNLVPVGEGISFVSRVEKVQVVERHDVPDYLKANEHPNPKEAAELICKKHKMPEILGSSTFVMGINSGVTPVCQRRSRAWRFDIRRSGSLVPCAWSRKRGC